MQLAPHDGDLMHNYGWYLCQQRRFADADAEFKRAIAEPSYRSALAHDARRRASARRAPASRRTPSSTLSRAYELDPANPTIAVNLAEVLYRNGQYERARFYIRRVNNNQELASAQTLWLAARIEHKLGQERAGQGHGRPAAQSLPAIAGSRCCSKRASSMNDELTPEPTRLPGAAADAPATRRRAGRPPRRRRPPSCRRSSGRRPPAA